MYISLTPPIPRQESSRQSLEEFIAVAEEAPKLFRKFLDPLVPLLLEREFFIDTLLVRIHLIIEMILVDRPCAMDF